MTRLCPRVLVIDPESSGADLVRALGEERAQCSTYWQDEPLVRSSPGDTSLPESALVDLVDESGFDAVVAGSEIAVSAAEVLSARTGTATNEPAMIFHRRDKGGMLQALCGQGLEVPRSRTVSNKSKIRSLMHEFDLPVMVKPAGSAGSDSCLIADTWYEVEEHVALVLARPSIMGFPNDSVVIQEYVDGPQFFVNTVTQDGMHLVTDVYSCQFAIVSGSPQLRCGRSFDHDDERVRDVVEYVLRSLDALGVRNGAGHTEVRRGTNGLRLIEFNGRLMGPIQPQEFFVAAQGYSQASVYAAVLTRGIEAARQIVRSREDPATLGYFLLSAPKDSIFDGYRLDVLKCLKSYGGLYLRAEPGAVVSTANRVTTGALGMVFLSHVDEKVVEADLRAIARAESDGLIARYKD